MTGRKLRDEHHPHALILLRDSSDNEDYWDGAVKLKIFNPSNLAWEAWTGSSNSGANVVSSPSTKTTITDQASSSVLYVGKADVGSLTSAPAWQIKKLTSSGGITTTQYADGNSNYDNVWDNRASLSYS
jgi:hypothetical protein